MVEKLQHCLFEEMKNHFKLMEDNVINRISKDERPAETSISDTSVAEVKVEL